MNKNLPKFFNKKRLVLIVFLLFLLAVGVFAYSQRKYYKIPYSFSVEQENKNVDAPVEIVDTGKSLAGLFGADGEYLNQESKTKAAEIVSKIDQNFSEDFKNGEINFLNREKLSTIFNDSDLWLIEQLFELDSQVYNIRFPVFADCRQSINRDDFTFLDQPSVLGNRQITPVAVPTKILEPLNTMLSKLQEATGRKMYVESGYRSPYYQAYLFLKYTQQFPTVQDTAKQVALPCRSEHGTLLFPAVDLITADGISDQNVDLFTERDEYQWLVENARIYGFYLSFFGGNRFGYNFEPWHFHYEEAPKTIGEIATPIGMKRITAQDDWGKFIENLPLYPPGTKTMLLYRRENHADGSEFIKSYENYVYENYLRTFAVVDIPVSSQQDCSKHIVRLLEMYAEQKNMLANLQFPLSDGNVIRYADCNNCNTEEWLNNAMIKIGTQTWRGLFPEIKDEKEVQVGDLLIEAATTHEVDPIYGDAIIGHTAVVVGIAEDEYTGKRYYLIGSGSLPITNFRISRAENYWQGQSGWLSLEGYLLRAKRDSVEFYRIADKLDLFFN